MTSKTIPSSIQKFIQTESSGGVLLLIATMVAMGAANSSLEPYCRSLWTYKIGIHSDGFSLVKPPILWINDGFMAIFFVLVGLEIKREILIGELNSLRKASLPVFAAVGGMVLPMIIFNGFCQNIGCINGLPFW